MASVIERLCQQFRCTDVDGLVSLLKLAEYRQLALNYLNNHKLKFRLGNGKLYRLQCSGFHGISPCLMPMQGLRMIDRRKRPSSPVQAEFFVKLNFYQLPSVFCNNMDGTRSYIPLEILYADEKTK